MTILWLRHGETALNAARVMQPADTPLSALGLAQAEAAARRLATMRPRAILCSDMPRALQTALLLSRHCGLPVSVDKRLAERNFGALRGRPWSTLDLDPTTLQEAPQGGESMAQFHARAAEAWTLAAARRAALDGPLVVVSHGLLIHAVLARHAHWPAGALELPQRLGNASVSIVDAAPPHAVLRVGCTAHLHDVGAFTSAGGAA
jgi:probable phosphoglycerate mutase